jgi:hypothetical protein
VSDKFNNLAVDFVYDIGHPPSPETIKALRDFLWARLNKPKGINILLREINGTGKENISLADISEIEQKNRSLYSKEENLTSFVYLANAAYTESTGNNKTLGINYASTSIVLFGKTINSFSSGAGTPSYALLETTISEHEFAHLMGLVNKGSGMVSSHVDAAHGKHCTNSNCLSYYLVETSDIVSNLTGGKVPDLDTNCIKDLRRNGGK